MKGLQVTGGMADGVHWNSKSDFAYYFGAAMSAYTKNGNRWVVGGEYLEKHYPYKDLQIPVSQFTGEGGYYMNFLSDRKKTFFLSLGLSALAGYSTSRISGFTSCSFRIWKKLSLIASQSYLDVNPR